MPRLLDSLPFFTGSGKKTHSGKGCPLDQLLELLPGQPPCANPLSHKPSPLRDGLRNPVVVKPQQVLTWVALSPRDRAAGPGNPFPVIIDLGCSANLVVSEWHLENWVKSRVVDPFTWKVRELRQEIVASTGARTTTGTGNSLPQAVRQWKGFHRPTLLDTLALLRQHNVTDHLAVAEADIWLAANAPGERDEMRAPDSWFRLHVAGVAVRPGDSLRPPLLGLTALQEGRLLTPGGSRTHLNSLVVDLELSVVHLGYP